MASIEEIRKIIHPPLQEAVPKAMAFAIGMFDKQQNDADKEVGREMSNLSKRYVSVLQGITGFKDGWIVSPTPYLLSIDNEDAGIAIDIHWEVDLGTGNADITVELNKRKGEEGPGAKWKSKFHVVKSVKPNSSNLSPAKVMTDSAVRRFLKENAIKILSPLIEETDWEELTEAVEIIEVPRSRPTYAARQVVHPQDVKEYGGGQALRAIRMGNNSELISRVRVQGGAYMSGAKFMSTQAMAKTLADAGHDVWLIGREGGRDVYVALRPKGIRSDKGARRASYTAYGEPWDLEIFKHAVGENVSSKHVRNLRKIMESRGRPYGGGLQGKDTEMPGLDERKGTPYEKRRSHETEAGYDKHDRKYFKGGPTKDKPWGQASKGSKERKKAHSRSIRQSKKKEIAARMRGEDAVNFADELRAIIERKGTPYGKQGGSKEADLWNWEKKYVGSKRRSGHAKQAKKMARKGERQAAKKEIQARLKGEDVSRKDLLLLIDIMAEEIDELQEFFFLENDELSIEELDQIIEAIAVGRGGAFEVPSPVPHAKKASLKSRRLMRQHLRKTGMPMNAQHMLAELAQVASSLPAADRKLVNKVLEMTWYGPEDLGGEGMAAYVVAIKKLHKKIFGRVRGTPMYGESVTEAKSKRVFSTSGDITFKVGGRLSRKHIQAMDWYMKRWADGGERAGPSMILQNKRWACTGVKGGGNKFTVTFSTDAPGDGRTLEAIEEAIIGANGFGGMLWDFAVHDVSAPEKLQYELYDGWYEADDDLRPIRYVNAGID